MPATWKRPWHFAWTLERQDQDGKWHAAMDTRLVAQGDGSPTHLAFLRVLTAAVHAIQRDPVPRLPMPGWCNGLTPWSLSHLPKATSAAGNRVYLGQTRLWGIGAGFALPASVAALDVWDALLAAGETALKAESLPLAWQASPASMTAHALLDAAHAHSRLAPPSDTTLRLLVCQTPTSWDDMAKTLGYDDEDSR